MNNGTKPIEWSILIATIAGVVATISQPFIDYWLETRIDKKFEKLGKKWKNQLEEKEKRIKALEESQQNYEKEKHSETRGLVKKFKEMHTSNAKTIMPTLRNKLNSEKWLEWELNFKDGEGEYDENFFEQMKKKINKLNIKDKENSFVGIVKIAQTSYRSSFSDLETNESVEFMKWKEYKEIFSKSTSLYSYITNLNNFVGDSKKILLSSIKIDSLCSKILS